MNWKKEARNHRFAQSGLACSSAVIATAWLGGVVSLPLASAQPAPTAQPTTAPSDPSQPSTITTRATVTGAGTTGQIPKWTSATTLGNSVITEKNGLVGFGTTNPTSRLTISAQTSGSTTYSNADGTGIGVFGRSTLGTGVIGVHASATGAGAGVQGISKSIQSNANGILGQIDSTSPGSFSAGVRGVNSGIGTNGMGVLGSHAGSGYGVYGSSTSGIGVFGDGVIGIDGIGRGVGVRGTVFSADSLGGLFTNTSTEAGSGGGVAVRGLATGGTVADLTAGAIYKGAGEFAGANGVIGATTSNVAFGIGVLGLANRAGSTGVRGANNSATGLTYGVNGYVFSPEGYAGYFEGGKGVYVGGNVSSTGALTGTYVSALRNGASDSDITRGSVYSGAGEFGGDYGVIGATPATTANGIGVLGLAYRDGSVGTRGANLSSTGTTYGVSGSVASPNGYAGFFSGGQGVYVQGNLQVTGVLSKGSGTFKIDHPLDPANKYLSHSFIESPEMMNVYNGNILLDGNGEATVKLPDYFEALNKEFRYQLTSIGGPGANLYIAEEVKGNHFKIAGGKAGLKVSWQVTGVRQDAFANANRVEPETLKTGNEQGRYLYPELFGQGKERGLAYLHNAQQMKVQGQQTQNPKAAAQMLTQAEKIVAP